jgi:hypothetical protein
MSHPLFCLHEDDMDSWELQNVQDITFVRTQAFGRREAAWELCMFLSVS